MNCPKCGSTLKTAGFASGVADTLYTCSGEGCRFWTWESRHELLPQLTEDLSLLDERVIDIDL
jgi:hypothetical protein